MKSLFEQSLSDYQRVANKESTCDLNLELGKIAHIQGDFSAAIECFQRSVAIWRDTGSPWFLDRALITMGAYALFEGINELSRRCLEEALALGQKTGKHFRIARSHLFLGRLAWAEGDRDLAARKLAEAQAAAGQDVNDSDLAADLLIFRGVLAWAGGDQKEAEASLKEALKAAWRMERWGYGGAGPLDAQAQLKARRQPERAARLFGAAERRFWDSSYFLTPVEHTLREAALAQVKAALGEPRMAELWAEGRAMTSEAAIAYALEEENGE